MEDAILAPLAARLTHIVMAGPPANAWRAPKGTLRHWGPFLPGTSTWFDAPRPTTPCALKCGEQRRVDYDIRNALSALPGLELADLVDHGYRVWRQERRCVDGQQLKEEMEVDNSANFENEIDALWKDENVDDGTRLLETCLFKLRIWQQLSALASEHPLLEQRPVARARAASGKATLTVCVIPASGPAAWPRAVRAHVPPAANDSAQSSLQRRRI